MTPFELIRQAQAARYVAAAVALLFSARALLGADLPTAEEAKQLSRRELSVLRRQMKGREDEAAAAFKNAETSFLVGEYDKAIEEFLAVAREYSETSFRMRTVLRIGDIYYRQKKHDRAISYYERALKVPGEVWWPEETAEEYARADYMIGVCYFDQHAMNPAFTHFRGFVKRHSDSRFVDRAYDFIGRGNMDMKRYGQAIEAFRMIGTARLGKSPRKTVAPGEDLYIRVTDADVGLATKGATIPVKVATTAGDEEIVDLASLGLGSPTFLGMIRTRLGEARLTRSLDEAYSASTGRQIESWLAAGDGMEEEIPELEKALADVREKIAAAPAAADGSTDDASAGAAAEDPTAALRAEETRLADQIAKVRAEAGQLRDRAHGELDASYTRIEAVLAGWQVDDLEEEAAVDASAATDEADETDADDATEGGAKKDTLSDVFTPQQIADTRKAIGSRPTTAVNYRFRRALLEYWHGDLLRQYKTLDLIGSDTITVQYQDAHGTAEDGMERADVLGVASDGRLACVGPDRKSVVGTVILGDEVRVRVIDEDMDRTAAADVLKVAVSSVPKVEETGEIDEAGQDDADAEESVTDDESQSVSLFEEEEEEQQRPALVPEGAPSFELTLTETGPRTGIFLGAFPTIAPTPDSPVTPLSISLQTLIRIGYLDERTSSREGDWVAVVEVDLAPGAEGEQEVIEMQESSLDHRSELEKGVALGKLARVYQDLGLKREALRTFDDALQVVKKVVRSEGASPLGEEATFQMWDLYFASGDEAAAAEACSKLIAAFPQSPLADDALLIMGKAEKRYPQNAIAHFSRLVSRYPESPLAPEAQFRIAELKDSMDAFDVAAFESCANRYPGSNFAAKSLLRLAEYYIDSKDYDNAKDYLERVTLDFPDFDALDKTTYLRGICAYRLGDIPLAYTLMHEVVEKYPGSSVAKAASQIVKLLSKKMKQ